MVVEVLFIQNSNAGTTDRGVVRNDRVRENLCFFLLSERTFFLSFFLVGGVQCFPRMNSFSTSSEKMRPAFFVFVVWLLYMMFYVFSKKQKKNYGY